MARVSQSPANPRPSAPRVALIFEPRNLYARELLGGIGEFALAHGPWWIHYAEVGPHDRPPRWLASWDGQGMIVRGENRPLARAVAKLRTPAVDLTPSRLLPRAPWVKSDDAAIARLAADHFLQRGFRHFGYCGHHGLLWSERRGEGFAGAVRGAGHDCRVYVKPGRVSGGDGESRAIAAWLAGLPRPVGVFTCMDSRGRQVIDAARRAGLAVPEEVAVLGVDNDELFSTLSPLPLSSVALNPRRAGWEAAALLARMIAGESVGPAEHFIAPLGVVTRQSTDVLAVDDPELVEALRYIREHACTGIGVEDVLRHCAMSRRSLEMRLRALLGRTPREEIVRVKIGRAKELLAGTKLPVADVATRVGFEAAYFSMVFKHQTGLSPREYRRTHSPSG
jgi:LacI family transcriptional regulator